uniref:Phosphoglycerate mutase-like protein n=1 Tax=Ditylum brightwellii TaxID=49249 RepID=A0A6S8XB10_9STRA
MAPREENISTDAASLEDITRIYLIRHGDRFDYANPSWHDSAKKNGTLVTDPPLSALGHRQAKETAKYLMESIQDQNGERHGVSKILVSPYVRVIQTAVPTSDTLNLPLSIETGLSEAHATPGNVLPTPNQRFAYFPHIDTTYAPLLQFEPTPGRTCPKTGHPCEAFAGHYVKRMGEFARRVEETYRGQTIVCFSHAASVALVAAFLKCSMREFKFAPCGVYELKRRGDGPWELVSNGEANAHVSENSPTTYPWGFGEKHFKEGEGKYYGESEGIDLDYFVNSD